MNPRSFYQVLQVYSVSIRELHKALNNSLRTTSIRSPHISVTLSIFCRTPSRWSLRKLYPKWGRGWHSKNYGFQRKSGNVNYQFRLRRRIVATGPHDETKREKANEARPSMSYVHCRNAKCCKSKYCIYVVTIQCPPPHRLSRLRIWSLVRDTPKSEKKKNMKRCSVWNGNDLLLRDHSVWFRFIFVYPPCTSENRAQLPKFCAFRWMKILTETKVVFNLFSKLQ